MVCKMVSNLLKNAVEFFKTRQINAQISPKIQVSYEHWYPYNVDGVGVALMKEWEVLKAEIDKTPSCVKDRKWNTYRSGYKQEELTVEIDGVVMELKGAYYSDPDYKPYKQEEPKSILQQANESIDGAVRNTDIIWAITHCSNWKYDALIDFLNATRASIKG